MYCVLKCKILIAMRQKQNLLKTCWKIICRDFPICSYYDYNNKFSLAVRCLSKREEKKKKIKFNKNISSGKLRNKTQLWNEQLFPQKREVFFNFGTFLF